MEFIDNIQQKSAKIWSEFHMTLVVTSINNTGNVSHTSHETPTTAGLRTHAHISLIQVSSSNGFNRLRKKKNPLYFSYIRFYRFLFRINFIVQTSFRLVFLPSA